MTSSSTILLQRFEAKYLVDRSTRTGLEQDLRAIMHPDAHAGGADGYVVRSLYLDTADFLCYHEKQEGVPIRHKLRVRAYGADDRARAFVRLEVKSRYYNVCKKRVAAVPYDDVDAVLDAVALRRMPPPRYLLQGSDEGEFFRLQRFYAMRPAVIVQYRRTAYERKELARARANFDDELVATRSLDLFGPLRSARSMLGCGNSIFELKVDGVMPSWMHRLISKYDLHAEAISKYVHAVRSEARLTSLARAYA